MVAVTIDEKLKRLRYVYFTLSSHARLRMLINLGLVTAEMADGVSLEFFNGGLDFALYVGGAQRLLDACEEELQKG